MTLLAPGCGGSEENVTTAPTLPRALAETLADKSDAVAARLDEGDTCGAVEEVKSLEETALAAIDAGKVPAALAEELETTVAELVTQIRCEEEDDEDRGNAKGKGKGKNGNGGDD
jgi:hypothetical protein